VSELEPLNVADGFRLPPEIRALLRPGQPVRDSRGRTHLLPRFFLEIGSWEEAKKRKAVPHFTYAELLMVDCREADTLLNTFPHYVPCAVGVLAQYLERFREAVGEPVFIATNGGYRSPAHRRDARGASPHCWACAADIYRVGDVYLDDEKSIEKYRRIAEGLGQEVSARPYGHGEEETDDHLHLDIGYVTLTPGTCDEGEPRE
jgi:CubicO group peptidase (beta-lactamase class C family)